MESDSFLQAELKRLDLLLHRQILRLRATYQLSLDEFRGLYISDEQVDSFVDQLKGHEGSTTMVAELTARAEAIRRCNAERPDGIEPWSRLVKAFNLSPFEQDVLLLALAPELDLKYETLFAYLNNDITRKWPTFDLALGIFSEEPGAHLSLRRYLLPEATLFRCGLLQLIPPTAERSSWLASGFSLAPGISHYLLGFPYQDPRFNSIEPQTPQMGWHEVPLAADQQITVRQVLHFFRSPLTTAPILIFEGRYGAGRRLVAEALCRDLGRFLLHVDWEAARTASEPLPKLIQALALQQRLTGVGIYLDQSETFFDKEGNPLPESFRIVRQLAQLDGPIFLATTPGRRWPELMRSQRHLIFRFGEPGYPERRHLWESYLEGIENSIGASSLDALADRFVLTPGQIKGAVLAAVDARTIEAGASLSHEDLFSAARAQSDQSLGTLALKANTIHTWDDLVLPRGTLKRIKEITAAIAHQHVVYAQWGFERRISSGKGLKILFSGASGTGKTMTAGVIARELGLDLYKIDLSGVVSKYIGETEKNLDRIFHAAHASNSILFFDEADALFGKRSEVKDAHDRYANIEVAYLLQKLEEHEGAVILASNLSKNIDQAFSRRMHYVVEFPLPDEKLRERLWHGMFPSQTPLAEDVDFKFLAKQFEIAGGDIKNVALDAAFLAAQDGQVVTMKELVRAVARQLIKQGKVPSPTDLKQYHALIAQE